MARVFALLTLGVGCIALADLIAHPTATNDLANAAITTEKVGANALLGKTS